ncbi:NAD(P)-binding domain-containing protein [Candidatus Uhrbacteria bacterium]|nr:NAD(P)-binding domain-containing protein [Candidatus Uhrbacteria bacterium]
MRKQNSRFTVVVTRQIPGGGIPLLRAQKDFAVTVSTLNRPLTAAELKKFVKGADAILALLTDPVDGTVMDAAGKQLKIVANYAVGFDNINLSDAKQRGVVVTNAPSELICENVAEHAIAMALGLAHRIVESDKFVRKGAYCGWDPALFTGTLLVGKVFGIIGTGRIGIATARRAHALGMHVVYSDTKRAPEMEKELHARYCSKEELLQEADVVSLHVPLLPSTRHLIDTAEFAMMKKTAFVINTARGPVVCEKALLRALKTGRIAGAALDVYECEPKIDTDPNDHLELRLMDNVILTPHTASAAIEARGQMGEIAAKNIIAVLSGKPPLNPIK